MTEANPTTARHRPLASVVVVNWNGRAVLEECVESLLAQTYDPLEIVVVDNGSTDGSAEWVRERYGERVTLVALDENRGFAGGNNAGFDVARGEYILLLNNDAVAEGGWAAALVAAAEADPRIGGCTSKILLHGEPEYFENTGLLLYPDGSARGRARLEHDDGQWQQADEVAAPSGCACLYRRDALEQAGRFDPAFFAYVDDVELGLKCRVAGWRMVYVPGAVAWHKESRTAGKYSRLKAFLVERNRIWAMLKTYPWTAIVASPWHTVKRYGYNAVAVARGEGAAGKFAQQDSALALVWILVKAHASALAHLPRILKERRALQRLRPPGPHPLRPWLREHALTVREFTQVH